MIDTPLKLAAACPFQQTYSSNFRDEPNFLELSHVALARAVTRLNNRPRKRLGYQTPLEFLVRAGFALQN
jgi:hypothetical protein